MKIFNSMLSVAAVSTVVAFMVIQPAAAMPMPMPALDAPRPSEVIQVHGHGHHWHQGHHGVHGADNYYDNNDDSGVLFKSFVTGTLFSGASRAYSDHTSACASRYRSYDSADNSYQPNHGPRRQCR